MAPSTVSVSQCTHCDFVSLRKADTRRHIKQCHFVERYRCPWPSCAKSSKQQENFKTHWRVHLNDDEAKIYQPVCGNVAARARDTTQIDRHWKGCSVCKSLAPEGQKRFTHLPETFKYPDIKPESSGVNIDNYIRTTKMPRSQFDTLRSGTRSTTRPRARRATSGRSSEPATTLAAQLPLPPAPTTTTAPTMTTPAPLAPSTTAALPQPGAPLQAQDEQPAYPTLAPNSTLAFCHESLDDNTVAQLINNWLDQCRQQPEQEQQPQPEKDAQQLAQQEQPEPTPAPGDSSVDALNNLDWAGIPSAGIPSAGIDWTGFDWPEVDPSTFDWFTPGSFDTF